jgi:hypothetical protein
MAVRLEEINLLKNGKIVRALLFSSVSLLGYLLKSFSSFIKRR